MNVEMQRGYAVRAEGTLENPFTATALPFRLVRSEIIPKPRDPKGKRFTVNRLATRSPRASNALSVDRTFHKSE